MINRANITEACASEEETVAFWRDSTFTGFIQETMQIDMKNNSAPAQTISKLIPLRTQMSYSHELAMELDVNEFSDDTDLIGLFK